MKDNKGMVPFSIMALTVPAAEAAVGKNWLPTLVLILASFLVCIWMSVQEEPDWEWLRKGRTVALIFLLSWALGQTHTCWPGEKAEWAVPAGLLILATYAVWRHSAAQASSVLRYGLYFILGALAVLGIPELRKANFLPSGKLPDMMLAVVLLLPLIGRRNGNWMFYPIGIIALASAVLTTGSTSIYQYSRGLTVNGIAENLESAAACAITVGNFGFLCYLLDAIHTENRGRSVWIESITAFLIYAFGVTIRGEVYAAVLLGLWVVIPTFWSLNRKMKKMKKRA